MDIMNKIFFQFSMVAALLLLCSETFAGGPLATLKGAPVVHDKSTFPINYKVDLGRLGPLNNLEATALVDECFSKWENVSTASIYFENNGYLPVDLTGSYYGDYLWDYSDGINPVIFDDDGSLIDAYMGSGASESVLGFASFPPPSGEFLGEGMVVLNGKLAEDPANPGVLKATIVHELGHFIGLDHCQINTRYAQDGIMTDDKYVPTMFPFQTDNDTSVAELNPDDKAALTLLYPAGADSVYGKISGTVSRSDGSPVLGANVTAVMVGNEDMNRFSSVSDYYRQSTGAFAMRVLPGTYNVFIEPINTAFTGGSSVGPYSEILLFGASFIDPVTTEYYNGPHESGNEPDLNAYTKITVSAGEEVSDVDFIAEEDAAAELWSFIFELFFWIFALLFFGGLIAG